MEDWNRNDYQGRTKQQVEDAHRINNILITAFIVVLVLMAIFT